MEIYSYILSQNMKGYFLLKVFCSLMLDNDLIFAAFKADFNLLNNF